MSGWRGLVAMAWLLALSGAAAAAGADPALKTFLASFGDAVRKGDLNAVAEMAHFPLQQAAYRQPKTVAKSAFKAQFAFLKGDALGACLKTAAPQKAAATGKRLGAFVVDCDGNDFYFAEFGGKWLLSGYENINE